MSPIKYPLCIRVQDVDTVRAILPQIALFEWCVSLVAVAHRGSGGDNPHFHLVGRFLGAREESVKQRLRRVLSAGNETTKRGNGFCSIKKWDESLDAIAYLFHEKEDTPLLVQFQVPDSLISQARDRNLEIKAQVKAHRKAGRIDNARLFRMCVDACLEIQKTLDSQPCHFPKWRVFRCYYELCHREKKNFPPKFAMPGIIKRVQAELCGDSEGGLRQLYRTIFQEEFPDENAPWMDFVGPLDM